MNRTVILTVGVAILLVGSLAGAGSVAAQDVDADAEADRLEEEADRLQEELLTKVTFEIGDEAEARGALADPLQVAEDGDTYTGPIPPETPEQARDLGDALYEDLADLEPDIVEAQEALHDAADGVDNFQESLSEAAEDLRTTGDPVAEAERIDAEVIAEVNSEIDAGANAELQHQDPVELIDFIFEDFDPGDIGGTDDDDGTDEGADDDTDEYDDIRAIHDPDDGDVDVDEADDMAGFVAVAGLAALLSVAFLARRRTSQ